MMQFFAIGTTLPDTGDYGTICRKCPPFRMFGWTCQIRVIATFMGVVWSASVTVMPRHNGELLTMDKINSMLPCWFLRQSSLNKSVMSVWHPCDCSEMEFNPLLLLTLTSVITLWLLKDQDSWRMRERSSPWSSNKCHPFFNGEICWICDLRSTKLVLQGDFRCRFSL